MSLSAATAMRPQELLWLLLAIALLAVAFRIARPAEHRASRMAFTQILLSLAALAVAALAPEIGAVAPAARGAALLLAGLAAIQVAASLVFRWLLPLAHVATPRIAQDLTVTALSIAWVLLWLRLAGVDPSQLFTTSAIITAVLAFAMQDTLGNVLGGVALQLDSSLRVGDWVRIDDLSGRVADVRWRYTAIETRNRELVIVPNSWLMKNRFTVIRAPATGPLAWRRAVNFNIEHDADPQRVIAALEQAVLDARIDHVLAQPPPSAILSEIGSGYCRYTLRYWLGDPRFDDPADSAVRVHALAALERAGVQQGFPTEERLTIKDNERWRAASARREFERRVAAIRSAALFAGLPAAEQEALAGHLVHAPFAAGDVMTRQGAVAHWLYLIVQGRAQVLVDSGSGPAAVTVLGAGDFFGEMGMLTGEARRATVVALTAVDCYRLDKAGFAQVLQQRPEVAREVSAIAQAREADLGTRLAPSGDAPPAHGDLLARILNFFSLSA